MRRKILLLAALLALAGTAFADAVKDWKRDWDAAQSIANAEKRAAAEVAALEHLKGAATPDAARAALSVALDPNAHWKSHDAALNVLGTMTAEPVKAWAKKELASSKDSRTRALLCAVLGGWPDGWKDVLASLKDKDASVIAAAADALARVKEKEVVSALVAAVKDAKEPRTEDDLARALRALTGQKHHEAAEWASWWATEGEKFSFDAAPPAEAPREGGVPQTTSNGSGLYETISSNKVMFLIDTSYSMRTTGEVQEGTAGEKKVTLSRLEYVKNELCAAIEAQLTKKCLFNMIQFNTKVTPWKPKLVEASDANKKAAKAWVTALQPADETNTYDALEMAFADKQVDTIYLLTDGFPTNGKVVMMDAIRGEVRKWNDGRRVRINTICYVVGDGAKFKVVENKDMSKNFMKALAADNGGFCKIFE